MSFRLSEFAALAGMEIVRDGDFMVTGKLSTPMQGLCVPLRLAKYLDEVNANPNVAAVVTTREIAEGVNPRLALAVADKPDEAHSEVHAACVRQLDSVMRERPNSIDPTAIIHPTASFADYAVTIGPHVEIGAMVRIEAGTTVEEGVRLHSGVVLGVEGFNTGIVGGRLRVMPQLGGVRIKAHAELLAKVCVARALFGGETTIGEETMIDCHTYIAHDVQIGRRVQICALANILGRVEIGDEAYIGPSAQIINGAKVGAKAKVSMGSVVTRDVPDGTRVTGNFALPHDQFVKNLRNLR
tara:strand:+ start:23634 stop:24527 length:894 start_codon:yes stop_codon:yes gene_type:complete